MAKPSAVRIVGYVLIGLSVLVSLVAMSFNSIVRMMTRPGTAFDAEALPAAPDYASPAAWSALPEREDAADVTVLGLPGIDQRTAPADVFYVHPTTYIGKKWNGPIDDAMLNAATDRVATRLQASAWNACCAIYAPRYRQANLTGFTQPSDDSDQAFAVAYGDVATAFGYFVAHHHRDRPFFLAAHSQGTLLAERLLREEIANRPLRQKLIAAYLIGLPIPIAGLSPDTPVCAKPEQTGCVVSWNARGPQFVPGDFEFRRHNPSPQLAASALVCVNPLSFLADEAEVPASANIGALFFDAKEPTQLPGFASARCQHGMLITSLQGPPPRDFMSRLLDRAIGPGNYHPIDYQLFYVNLRQNAQARLAAFQRNEPRR